MKVICALKDVKADVFMLPMFVPTMGIAYRSIGDEIARGGDGNTLSTHPEDFQLWSLGTYDELHGVIKVHVDDEDGTGGPRFVCECVTLRKE